MKRKIWVLLTPIIFLILIFGLALWNLLTPDKEFSEAENRDLQKRPEFSWESLVNGKFTADVETWLTDQFCWRDGFVEVKATTEYVIGKRDTNGVYFARDGYLIEKHDSLDEQFEKNLKHLSKFVNYASDTFGSDHVRVMIAPTAGEILKDKLPPYAQEFSQQELLDRMEQEIPQDTWIDMLSVMRQHSEEYIYYKTDHHWTTDGAWYGYRAYCDSLGLSGMAMEDFNRNAVSDSFYGTIYSKARLPGTQPDSVFAYTPKEEFSYTVNHNMGQKVEDSLYVESWLSRKDKYSYFLGGNDALLEITGPNKNGKSLLVVKDSYAHCMAPFLANEYETVYLVDLRYFNLALKDFIAQQPDITDVLVLYNAVTFSEDLGVLKMDKGLE